MLAILFCRRTDKMLNKIIPNHQIEQIADLLNENDKFVIVTHVSPDGDAIGSSLGLYNYLIEQGREASVVVPNAFPQFLKWIPGAKDILDAEKYPDYAQKLIESADVIFCLDFNVAKRIIQLAPHVIGASAKKVMIDHHPHPDTFCDIIVSHPEISSTSELIFRLICRLGDFKVMSKASAEAIYTGMMTDTGGFTYNSNDEAIYYIIGELLRKGINKDQIFSNVYHNYSVDRFRMMGYVLSEKMRVYPEYRTAMISLSQEEQIRFNAQKGDTEGFPNMLLNIKDIVFGIFIREDVDFVKVSLRSQEDFPTNKFAAQCFNGGGHLNASGGEFHGTLDEAIALFEKTLPEYKSLLVKEK
mgnify:CR=1 FL=1